MNQATNYIDASSFLGLVGYHWRFKEGFSKIAQPITQLTWKGMMFQWLNKCEQSFQELRWLLFATPALAIIKGLEGFVINSNALKQSLWCVLM